MINCTDQPISLCEGAELDLRIRKAVKKVLAYLDKKYQIQDWIQNHRKTDESFGQHPARAFAVCFAMDNRQDIVLGNAFIQALFSAANIGPRSEGLWDAYEKLSPFLTQKISAGANIGSKLKGILKLLLLALWNERALILPFKFTLGGVALKEQIDFIKEIETEVASFFRLYKSGTAHRPRTAPPLPLSGYTTIYSYAPRVIWTTSWHRFEDVDLNELGEFQRFLNEKRNSEGVSRPPLALMLREMLECYPDSISYTSEELADWSLWSLRSSCNIYPFSEYSVRRLEQAETAVQKRKISSERFYKKQIAARGLDDKSELLENLAKQHDHAAIVEYFCNLRGVMRGGADWLRLGSPYIGRSHIGLNDVSNRWLEAWTAFMKYRKTIQGFDTSDGPERGFNVLCDYLFLYLPWWRELFPDAGIEVPASPNQLKRAVFIHRTQLDEGEPISISVLPLTFLDILPMRLPSAHSRYGTLHILMQFLEWLEIGFEDDSRIAGKGYRSPLRRIDLPRVTKQTKTTKTPFTKRVYPHLLFYSYAIESFGEYLQQLAIDSPDFFKAKIVRQQRFYNAGPRSEQIDIDGKVSSEYQEDFPDGFGYIPFICYRGKNYPIYRIPNVYNWAERLFDTSRYNKNFGVKSIWLPHLSTHRMLTGAVETGLRLQSLQWLDAKMWDIENKRQGIPAYYNFNMKNFIDGRFALPLHVSTDKTKDEAWTVLVPFRVRASFYREQYFRDSISEPGMDELVEYEGIENNRFGKILPLFRSSVGPAPISDNTYDRSWRTLLWGFEEYFNNNVANENEFVQFVYLRGTDQEPVTDYSETDIDVLRAINTPHACRATYATNRTGTLEASDVANQLGHSSTMVTAHYTVSTLENMEEKLLSVEREIQSSFDVFDRTNPSHIRADSPTSALYQGFRENREETINSFHFAPVVSLWKTEDLADKNDGLQLLKNSPMSQIIFRETHICPVGEACPADILIKIGEPRRCGLCPLAMKCVDHLPAIAAKTNQLKMKIRTDIKRAEQLTARNEPQSTVDVLYDAADLDANEVIAWQLSHDILLRMLKSRVESVGNQYLVQSPEIVQRHLMVVSSDRTVSEFLLQRIADANAYPSLADPEIQRVANRFCRYLLAGNYQESIDDDPVTVLAGLVKTKLEPLGLGIKDLADRIDQFEHMSKAGRESFLMQPAVLLGTIEESDIE